MGAERLADVLGRFAGGRIWVVGDIILDEYFEGRVSRISPEAPVPVVHVASCFHRLGGAANVANGARALGAQVELAGIVGCDEAGARVRALCEEAALGGRAILSHGTRPTTKKLRVLAQRQQLLRMDWEDTREVEDDFAHAIVERLLETGSVSSVVLSDYAKGLLGRRLIADVVRAARGAGVPVVADPKSADFSKYAGATVLTPNLRELEVACGQSLDGAPTADLASIARGLLREIDVQWLIVTLGERGMLVTGRAGETFEIPARAREVFDVTGAGDTVTAVLALALAVGADVTTAATLANAAAGVVVGKVGTATVTVDEITSAMNADRPVKALDASALMRRAAEWKKLGRRIVFTNGCFDLLHAGHVRLLQSAAAEGDVLVVGLNSDASVRRLKGAERPLVTQTDRAALLAALDCVHAVTVFDEDTPAALIAQLRPDVLVKGGDYTPDNIVGRELVESQGGRTVIVPLVPGLSTTNLVAALRPPPSGRSHGTR